jgi:hypothetical protein
LEAINVALEEWKEQQRTQGLDPDTILQLMHSNGDGARAMEEHFSSHLQLPTKEEMEQMLIERRKQVRLIGTTPQGAANARPIIAMAYFYSFFF